jgi:hypothetical protein
MREKPILPGLLQAVALLRVEGRLARWLDPERVDEGVLCTVPVEISVSLASVTCADGLVVAGSGRASSFGADEPARGSEVVEPNVFSPKNSPTPSRLQINRAAMEVLRRIPVFPQRMMQNSA